ncbi:hypothetical protein GCM10009760_11910 [Kitasatospora kazusensis]|uniref:Zinc finger protein n=1 Tax=Kitasatospora kazusensis TaxID=407974 RepID=A0ABP5KR86_9ACTN
MTPHAPSWSAADGSFPHPDIDLLADLSEGLVGPADLPALQEHLDRCEECADTLAALTEVRELLGSVDTPPMPADVAARIDSALAAEAAAAAAAREAAEESGNAPEAVRAPVPAAPAPLSGALAPPNRRSEGTGPGRPRSRRRRILVGTAAVLTTLGLAALLVRQTDPAGQHPSASAAADSSVGRPGTTADGPVYQDGLLTAQIQQLLAASGTPKAPSQRAESFHAEPRPAASPKPDTTGPDSAPPTTAFGGSPAGALPDCLPAATGHGAEAPLAVGHGRYGPADVTALVYPLPGRPGELDVYLVTSGCPGATVVLHRTVPSR